MTENGLTLLNSNFGSTNIVSKEVINSVMDNTISLIGKLLEGHCGPYGKFAMITPGVNNPTAEPKFTKDGINIIKATSFINPIETHTRDMMAYIGKKIESAAGDGTTSSMLISSYLIKEFRDYLLTNNVLHRNFLKAYDNFIINVSKGMNKSTIMANDDVKLIKGIAYHQSMSSSHGDVELSLLASELLSSIPKHAWKNLIYKRESRETKDRFKIEIDNSSYSAEALFF